MESTTPPNAFDIKGMMSEEAVKKAMEAPAQAMSMMVETTKKVQEASVDYFRQVEKIQREHWQGMSKLMNISLPGESKIWEAQNQMIEQGFEMVDRMMAMGKKA